MAAKNLKIDQLELDISNPRFNKAAGQSEAMQRILEDQDVKLANLAESIADEGLNPMDRLLVIKSSQRAGKYVVLEGNRRTAALKVLRNPAILTGLDVRSGLQKRLEKIAQTFDPKSVEPIPCFEVLTRSDANTWLAQRHSGENEGRGIVNWSGVAGSRFRGTDPALQALDFVRQHADLSDEQKKLLDGRFPITTLDRLLSTPSVRTKLGFEIKDNKLLTSLPPDEAIKPLRRIVLDLAEGKENVTKLKLVGQQVDYVSRFTKRDTADHSKKTGSARALEAITEKDFNEDKPSSTKKKAQRSIPRHAIVPRTSRLNITNPKISEIYQELKTLRLDKYPNAIAVMLRVFVETSVDHYLSKVASPAISLSIATPGGDKDKSLQKKIEEAIDEMTAKGATKKDFDGMRRGLSNKAHPLSVDLLHSYIHSRFVAATERELTVAWDGAQPFFDRIWP
jgi:hypothetical protein